MTSYEIRLLLEKVKDNQELITNLRCAVTGRLFIFLDEIQELSGWEQMVNSLRVDLNCDIYVTGSNSKLLSGEMATYLAGRYIEIPVYPFSFREIMKTFCPLLN